MNLRPTVPAPDAYPFRDHRTLAEVWQVKPEPRREAEQKDAAE